MPKLQLRSFPIKNFCATLLAGLEKNSGKVPTFKSQLTEYSKEHIVVRKRFLRSRISTWLRLHQSQVHFILFCLIIISHAGRLLFRHTELKGTETWLYGRSLWWAKQVLAVTIQIRYDVCGYVLVTADPSLSTFSLAQSEREDKTACMASVQLNCQLLASGTAPCHNNNRDGASSRRNRQRAVIRSVIQVCQCCCCVSDTSCTFLLRIRIRNPGPMVNIGVCSGA
jgi:hypothetical protein